MLDKPLPGYPLPVGGRNLQIIQHQGPKVYASGGETFDAIHLFGGGVLDMVDPTAPSFNASATGTYFALVRYPIGQGNKDATGSTSVILQWYVTAGGAEVGAGVDLSGEFLRLLVLGG